MMSQEINPRTGKPYYYQKGNDPETQRKRNNKSNPKHNPKRMWVDGKYIPNNQLVHSIATPDRARAERVAHKAAALCGERQGEWFKIANEEAVTILQHIKETEDEQKRESTN